METYILNAPNGAELEINIIDNDAKITIIEEGLITKKIELKNLDINFKTMELTVNYIHTKYVGEIQMNSDLDFSVNSTDFNYFLNLAGIDGNKIIKHCLNGILFKLYGYRCFDATGTFHNYVAP